jgi:alpha/beta superfamily hydrolase
MNTVNYSDILIDIEHKMDIYTPDGDTETSRPVVLYMHGGSFYGGDKNLTDCVDFCTSMAKRGYVAISANYRLNQNPVAFIYSQEEQFRTVLKAVSDIKAAIRYLRKDHSTGNSLATDPNAIYVGGYSAGGVLAVHLAYIDQISDLPTSPINVQNLVANIGGTLEGDGGNTGYSSEPNGVFSFAGAINDLTWIDGTDEPLVSVQGNADGTVSYNCAPGLGLPTVLTLCGTGEMHPQADAVGLYNQSLTYPGEDHNWGASGDNNPLFIQATQFVVDFLYTILPCNPNSLASVKERSFNANIFPNPSNGLINIESDSDIQSIVIYNSIGVQVYSNSAVGNSVSIDNLLSGIYLLEIKNSNEQVAFKKIIIQ